MNGWSCAEIDDFESFQVSYAINAFVCKGLQILVFLILVIIIVYQVIRGKAYISKLPFFIALLCLFNGVFALVRFRFFLDAFSSYKLLTISFFAESLTFFSAIWLFGIKMYEMVHDLRQMVSEEVTFDKRRRMRARKQIYAIIRWTIFALVVLFSSMQCFVQLDTNLNDVMSLGLVGVGYLFLSLVSIASYLLETIALCRFLKIVHRAGINQHLKSYLLWL